MMPEGTAGAPQMVWNQALGELEQTVNTFVEAVGDAIETVSDVASDGADAVEAGAIAFGEFLEENIPTVDIVVTDANNDGEYFENTSNPDIEVTKEDVEVVKTAVGGASKSLVPKLGPSTKRASSATDKLNGVTNSEADPKIDTVKTQVNTIHGVANQRIVLHDGDTADVKTYIPDELF